jgi:histone-lysine N-methyltransferase SETMAR
VLQNQFKPAIRKNAMVSYLLECLQHDNAQPNTAHHTMKPIQDLKMEVSAHLPHSPDVVPSDFHLFWSLKDDLCGQSFR